MQSTAKQLIDETINYLGEKPSVLVKCPACDEEWNKLSPCFFAGDVSHLCIQCAESAKSFEWVVRNFPFIKSNIEWEEVSIWSKYPEGSASGGFVNVVSNRQYLKQWISAFTNKIAGVRWMPYQGLELSYFLAFSAGAPKIKICLKDEGVVHKSENILEAWDWIKKDMLERANADEAVIKPRNKNKFAKGRKL